jgi:hypothetical protein
MDETTSYINTLLTSDELRAKSYLKAEWENRQPALFPTEVKQENFISKLAGTPREINICSELKARVAYYSAGNDVYCCFLSENNNQKNIYIEHIRTEDIGRINMFPNIQLRLLANQLLGIARDLEGPATKENSLIAIEALSQLDAALECLKECSDTRDIRMTLNALLFTIHQTATRFNYNHEALTLCQYFLLNTLRTLAENNMLENVSHFRTLLLKTLPNYEELYKKNQEDKNFKTYVNLTEWTHESAHKKRLADSENEPEMIDIINRVQSKKLEQLTTLIPNLRPLKRLDLALKNYLEAYAEKVEGTSIDIQGQKSLLLALNSAGFENLVSFMHQQDLDGLKALKAMNDESSKLEAYQAQYDTLWSDIHIQ